MSIAIINSSVSVSDEDGYVIVNALNKVLPNFCSDWGIANYVAQFIPKGSTSSIPIKIFIFDNSDITGGLGYHDLSSPIPYGKCFAHTILMNGGAVLHSSDETVPTVSQAISHEVFEILVDPHCNGWWDTGDKKILFARETVDPVECNKFPVSVLLSSAVTYRNPRTRTTSILPPTVKLVSISDWILPAWSDPQNTIGPFNHLNTLKAPFTIDTNGYAMVMTPGGLKPITAMRYGPGVTDDLKERYCLRTRIFKRKT